MATRTPGLQPRSQTHNYWGVYSTFEALPNGVNNPLPSPNFDRLEEGDWAYDQETMAVFSLVSPGTNNGGDAVWRAQARVSGPFVNASGGPLAVGHVVIATTGGIRQVTTTTTQADTRVLGVIAVPGNAGQNVWLADWGEISSVIVDAAANPIQPGDRLVTATTAGRARKAPAGPATGTTFAKALEAANADGVTIDALTWSG